MFNILINKYGYQKSHIFFAVSDGTSLGADLNVGETLTGPFQSSPLDYDGDGDDEQNIYPATRDGVDAVFSTLGQLIGSDDDVFVFVTDHGDRIGDTSYIILWNGMYMSPYEFNEELKMLHNYDGRINIMMGQCYSGGFLDYISRPNVSITTSVSANETAKARDNLQYSEFLYYWLSAVNGSMIDNGNLVNADVDDLMGVSFYEAFQYARNADEKGDHALYKSVPDNICTICTLGYDQFLRPVISGTKKISNIHGGSYSIQNLPEGATVAWTPSSALIGTTSSATSSFRYSGRTVFETSTLSATITIDNYSFKLANFYIDCWGRGNYPAVRGGANGYYELPVPNDAYGFKWGCDANWYPLYQNRSYVNFQTKKNSYPTEIWCEYYTPLGENSRAYMRCESYGMDPLGIGGTNEELNEF